MSDPNTVSYHRYKHMVEQVGPTRAVDRIMLVISRLDTALELLDEGHTGRASRRIIDARDELAEILGLDKEKSR